MDIFMLLVHFYSNINLGHLLSDCPVLTIENEWAGGGYEEKVPRSLLVCMDWLGTCDTAATGFFYFCCNESLTF